METSEMIRLGVTFVLLAIAATKLYKAWTGIGGSSKSGGSSKGRPKSKWFGKDLWLKQIKAALGLGFAATAAVVLYWWYAGGWFSWLLVVLLWGIYIIVWWKVDGYGKPPYLLTMAAFAALQIYVVPEVVQMFDAAPKIEQGETMATLRGKQHKVVVASQAKNRLVRLYLSRQARLGEDNGDAANYCYIPMTTLMQTAGGTWIPELPDSDPGNPEWCYALCVASRNLAEGENFTACRAEKGSTACDREATVEQLDSAFRLTDPNGYVNINNANMKCDIGPGFLENPVPSRR